ncbi:MAG: hypothetical protein ACK5L0_03600 [Candidatus Fimivivens sp.]
MQFDFKVFSAVAARAYQMVDNPAYTLREVLAIFGYYFQKYEETFGQVHPNIRTEQIASIIERMPYIDDEHGRTQDIDPESYQDLIDQHFRTQYRNCNYRINHFFSGSIRTLRYYETCY